MHIPGPVSSERDRSLSPQSDRVRLGGVGLPGGLGLQGLGPNSLGQAGLGQAQKLLEVSTSSLYSTSMIKNEMTNNEMIDLTKMVACVGVEACDGIVDELDGLSESTLELFNGYDEDGYNDEGCGELIKCKVEDIGSVVSYEEGCKEVVSYFEDYCLWEENEDQLEVLKDLLVKLKEKTEGKNVKWILWGIETDIALGFIE